MVNLSGLNPPQREAASILSGPLLVLAGAGTGKTRVITYRMANLIAHGIRPDRILSVTFTNKAAREMRERAGRLIGRQFKQRPVVSTFHSYCVRVLREDIESLGYPKKFAIYDRSDQESAARTALRDIRMGDGAMKPGDLINRISRWKMQGIQDHEASDNVESDFDLIAAMGYKRYQKQLRASGAVDFDDLLLLTVKLFQAFPDVLQRHQSRFDHVQIDEYQDTNGVQFQLIESLVKPHRNLCVVGDDDQSIYGWRGADVEHIINFSGHFPGARVVRLEDNYRCTDRILECANRLVKHNRQRHDKTLIPNKKSGAPIRIQAFDDETAEAENVVSEISYLIKELGVKAKQVAILFRTNEQPRVFEQELRRQQVPYMLVGGQSFYDRREIRDLLSYLKSIDNPRDEVSLLRVINTPTRGIGATTTEKVIQMAVKKGRSFWDILPEASASGAIPAKTLTAMTTFRSLLERYAQAMHETPQQLAEICRRLISEIDYASEITKQYKDEAQQESRRTILEEFINSIGQYVERTEDPSLSGFLETTALMDREDEADRSEKQDKDEVRLMTLHSAKGLEFPRVYLVGMEEGFLPHKRSIDADSEKDIAEERRLAYVGVTRAMDHLTLTRAKTRMKWGKRRETVPSRFLFEMQLEPGNPLPEEHISREEGSSSEIQPGGEASPVIARPALRPLQKQQTATPPNEFEAPPF
ncbi:MAG TPA: UvrD-helicase domain-containing protein [Planctomycetaceae bacterium]|nr:UvrD-helicase domain-containing protein [Planctomycetaceae bacterium]